jgi:uncharacterized protein (TIGR02646 family)
MRKLNRPLPAPDALTDCDHNVHVWNRRTPSQACRRLIWQNFQSMQGKFCAFCERSTEQNNGHIEHFFHKGQQPDGTTPYKHLTFSWSNLFGCCGKTTSNTCGHFKDRIGDQGPKAYNANELIKPDVENPIHYLDFLGTGLIEAKVGLSVDETKKATETIRVLNLGALNGARKKQIDIFKNELKILEEISHGLDEQELFQEMNNIKNKVQQQEYQTAVLEALF